MIQRILDIIFKLRVRLAGQYRLPKIYARKLGIKFGNNVRITGRVVWGTEPYLIEIGDNTSITQEVRFITHGGVSKLRKEYPGINYYGRIKIGSNVIIGACSIILPGVTIGDNTIIGAGSVVTKSIPSDVIAGGNPARVIQTLEEYKKKKIRECIFVFEKDPKKRKAEIIQKLAQKEKELGLM